MRRSAAAVRSAWSRRAAAATPSSPVECSAWRRAATTAAGGSPDPYAGRKPIDGVAHVVAVASGKGGVGKSTTACNLAVAAAASGLRVGLLDADIYGPSVPLLMGLPNKPPLLQRGTDLMLPPLSHGVSCQSMALLLKPGASAAWRGPMVMGALQKLIRGTAWPPLDILFVDMPPGTGDAHLSLCQKLPLSGVVLVSTPQEVALVDARRGADFFAHMGIRVLGYVENMAYFVAPNTAERLYLFGRGGVAQQAQQAGVPLLGEVPLVCSRPPPCATPREACHPVLTPCRLAHSPRCRRCGRRATRARRWARRHREELATRMRT